MKQHRVSGAIGLLLLGMLALPSMPANAALAKPLAITTTSLPAADIGSAYTASVAVTGGKTPYSWSVSSGVLPSGLSLNMGTGVISGTPSSIAVSDTITITVTDSSAVPVSRSASFTLIVYPALNIATLLLPAGRLSTAYSTTLLGSGGKTPYTWALANKTSLPTGLSLNSSTGVISGTPTAQGTVAFYIKLTDASAYSVIKQFSITVNTNLSITSSPTLSPAMATRSYSWTLVGSGGKTPYKWFMSPGSSLPAGLTLATSSGVVSGTPSVDGTFTFSLQVTDNNGYVATQACSISIAKSLVITTASIGAGVVNKPLPSVTFAAIGGSSPYAWSISAGTLPAGLSLAAGVLSGTPTAAGTSNFTVRALDSLGFSATKAFTLVVNPALSVLTSSLRNGESGTAYTETLTAVGGNGIYTWSAAAPLPEGFILTESGTLTVALNVPEGTYNFTVQVTDGNAYTATRSLSLVIDSTLVIVTTTLANAESGTAYSETLTATGGSGTYTWSSVGTLPDGFALSTDGILTVTDTVTAGDYVFTVQVTDGNGFSATQALTLHVDATLMILTTTLANAESGTAYTDITLSVTGGNGSSYAWAITSGALPDGVTLDASGLLSGTPRASGEYQITVQVTDGNGFTTTQVLTLTVVDPLPPV